MEDKSVISSHSHKSTGYRYEGNLVVFGIQIVAFFVCHTLLSSTCSFFHIIGSLLAVVTAFFSYTWVQYHSSGLTRQKRAHFNEKNVIETYQPRARLAISKFFNPDPPTPAPLCCAVPTQEVKTEPDDEAKPVKITKEQFDEAVKDHYAGEFITAQKINNAVDLNTAQSPDADAEQDKGEKVEDDEDFKALSKAIAEATKDQSKPSSDGTKADDEDGKKD